MMWWSCTGARWAKDAAAARARKRSSRRLDRRPTTFPSSSFRASLWLIWQVFELGRVGCGGGGLWVAVGGSPCLPEHWRASHASPTFTAPTPPSPTQTLNCSPQELVLPEKKIYVPPSVVIQLVAAAAVAVVGMLATLFTASMDWKVRLRTHPVLPGFSCAVGELLP